MTEESEPKLPMPGRDFLEHIKTRHRDLPNVGQMSLADIVSYIKNHYLKPNWPHWRNMSEVSLKQAVWLSLNIEPWKEDSDVIEAIPGINVRPAKVWDLQYHVYLVDALRKDYQPRMEQCLAAIKTKALPARWRDTSDPDLVHDLTVRWYVSLEQFRNWGESLRHPYPFPAEFPRPVPAAPKIPTILADEGALTPYASSSAPPPLTTEQKIMLQVARAAWSAGAAPSAGSSTTPSLSRRGTVTWTGEHDELLKEALSQTENANPPPEAPASAEDEKPLGRRERNTLLTMVAAMSKALGIDLSQPSKAAVAIEDLTTKIGARVAARTIENHLKRIPEAIESKAQ